MNFSRAAVTIIAVFSWLEIHEKLQVKSENLNASGTPLPV
jgi:hypothetical protein